MARARTLAADNQKGTGSAHGWRQGCDRSLCDASEGGSCHCRNRWQMRVHRMQGIPAASRQSVALPGGRCLPRDARSVEGIRGAAAARQSESVHHEICHTEQS